MNENQDNIKIRRMVESDLAKLNDVDYSILNEGRISAWPYSFAVYWRLYNSSNMIFVAEFDGQVTGFLAGYIEQEERSKSIVMRPHKAGDIKRERKIGWIEIMGIRPADRGKGIGIRLIEAFQDECKNNSAMMRVVLRQDDTEPKTFFRHIGFKSPEFITLEKNS